MIKSLCNLTAGLLIDGVLASSEYPMARHSSGLGMSSFSKLTKSCMIIRTVLTVLVRSVGNIVKSNDVPSRPICLNIKVALIEQFLTSDLNVGLLFPLGNWANSILIGGY